MIYHLLTVIFLLTVASVYTVISGKLTIAAGITGGIIGLLLFYAGGYSALTMMAIFFLLASMATSWKLGTKQRLGLAENEKGKRTTGQVLANADNISQRT